MRRPHPGTGPRSPRTSETASLELVSQREPCSFWLVSALALNGRIEEARALFERLISLANDLGLLAEEYDVGRKRQVGNFPQAFSHLTLILAARAISSAEAQAMQVAV
jgi:GH15 family glucan-1,4-alpha-glucosidase